MKEENKSGEGDSSTASKDSNEQVMAILSYLGILVLIPLLVARDNEFVKYHIRQGIVLLIAWVALSAFSMIPIIGWIFGPILMVVILILVIIGILNAVGGKKKPLPILGQYASKFDI